MPNNELILDIRYYESDVPNTEGTDPVDVGKLLKLPKFSDLAGARIARKLRELGFITGDFNHVYINFTTVLPPDEISYANRSVDRYHPWYRYVDVGVNPAKINKLSATKKQQWLNSITLQVAEFLAAKKAKQKAIVKEVREQLAIHGDAMPIVHKTKETKTYSVTVSYQIAPKIKESTAWVDYVDQKSGEHRRGCFAKLEFYEDILFLVSSISVKGGTIVFKPRASFKESRYNKNIRYRLRSKSPNCRSYEILPTRSFHTRDFPQMQRVEDAG